MCQLIDWIDEHKLVEDDQLQGKGKAKISLPPPPKTEEILNLKDMAITDPRKILPVSDSRYPNA